MPLVRSPARALLSVAALAACAAPRPPAPVTDGDGFFDRPWPSDLRRDGAGLDMTGFPNPGEVGLVQKYLDLAASLDGFGTNPTIYVRFDGALDTDLLPDPEGSVTDDATVYLLDIDPQSPDWGTRVPISWDYQPTETAYQPADLLSVQPVWGFPLRANTSYALVVTTAIAAPADGFSDVWSEGHADYATFAPLERALAHRATLTADVAVATVFTTRDPTDEMARFAWRIQNELSLPVLDQELSRWKFEDGWSAFEGKIWVPLWQHGTRPYLSSGGGFAFDEDGMPVIADWEEVYFTFSVPRDTDGPIPVVIYSHGTGGDWHTFADGSGELVVAKVLADKGLAGFGISQPLHGDRGTGMDPTLISFNYLNPDSALANFRQGALDQLYLAEVLSASEHCFGLFASRSICTDPDKVAFLGHSQGGIVGAMAAPFFDGRVSAAVLSGAGGGLSVTVVERPTEEIDIEELLADTLQIDADEELDTFHPMLAVVQMLSDVTDPLNYARYWQHEAPWWQAMPTSVLMTEGLQDTYTPPSTTEALAGAAGLPVLEPVAHASTVARMRGLVGEAVPTAGNLRGWDGTPVSGGLAQFPDHGHFPIFEDEGASAMYADFLETALAGDLPEISER